MNLNYEKSLLVGLYCCIFSLLVINYTNNTVNNELILVDILIFLIAIFFFGNGLFVFFRSKKKNVTNYFVFLCFQFSSVFLFLYSNIGHVFMESISLFLLSLLPLSLLRFLGYFLQIKLSKLMYIILVSCCLISNIFFNFKSLGLPLFGLAFLICSSFTICYLEYRSNQKKNFLFFREYRRLFIRSVLVALCPFVIFWVIPSFLGVSDKYTNISFFSLLLVLVLPATVTYILLKNNALPKPPSIKNVLPSLISKAGIITILGFVLFFLGITSQQVVIILHFILISLISMKMIEQRLKKRNYDLAVFSGFSTEKTLLDFQLTNSSFQYHLALLIVYVLKKIITISEIHILLVSDQATEEFSIIYSEGEFPKDMIEEKIKNKVKSISFIQFGERELGIFPIYLHEEILGWIVFGNSIRRMSYTEDQIEQISQIQPLISNLIASIRDREKNSTEHSIFPSINEKNNLEISIDSILNREKIKFRNTLHDVILQDVIILVQISRKLANQQDTMEQNETKRVLNGHCENLMLKIRTILKESMPPTLYYTDITQSLAFLIDNMNEKSAPPNEPIFTLSCPENFQIFTQERIEFFYRIVKELNDNAFIHANATWIRNKIILTNRDVILTVQDDGVGINTNRVLAQKQSPDSLGLVSIIHDVRNIGGQVKIRTRPIEKGTIVEIVLPKERII